MTPLRPRLLWRHGRSLFFVPQVERWGLAPSPSLLGAWSSASEASSSSSSEDSGVAGCGFPSTRASLHALSCLAFLVLFLSSFVSAASFRLFIFSAWR